MAGAPALVEDLGLDAVGGEGPAAVDLAVSGGGGDVGGVVEGGPAHDLGIDEVLLLAADLPDAAVLEAPVIHDSFGQALHDLPSCIGYAAVQQEEGVDGNDHFAEHIQLQMF